MLARPCSWDEQLAADAGPLSSPGALAPGGQRKELAEPQGRGIPGRWQHMELDALPEGLRLRFRLKTEMLIPWRDPQKPGRLADSDNADAEAVKIAAADRPRVFSAEIETADAEQVFPVMTAE